ncbi:helix-turn-helix transcriptional regulator [Catelliglobosispora koreensis]|uniref:helix-turn-helix transcriptional regulator n=1 Tax=Catelliglobosispora koreensis TaxID=129052 RepID=UPI00037A5C8A|nr:helix-turn-helix transcriptional regulator [Catelliglobosispora koreensis]
MDRAEAADLLRQHFGQPVPARLAEQLWRRTGGEREWLTAVLDQIDPSHDGLHRVPVEFPEELTAPLKARLLAVSPQARAVLEAASVLGREFDLALLERMLSNVDVLEGLAEAQQAGLIKALPAQVYRFDQAPVRELCYESLGPKHRAQLHDEAAAALAALGAMGGARAATIAELAYHTSEAAALGGSTRLDAAAAASVSAGVAASETGSHELAAEYFAQAATMAGRAGWAPAASGRLLVAAGEARLRSARSAQLREVGRASLTGALRLGSRARDAGLMAAAALGLGPRLTLGPLAARGLGVPASGGKGAPATSTAGRGARREGGQATAAPAGKGTPGTGDGAVLAPGDEVRREALMTALQAQPEEASVVARLKARLALEAADAVLAAKALDEAGTSGDPRAHAEALIALATLSGGTQDLLPQAFREAEVLGDRELLVRVTDLLATAAWRDGQRAGAIEYLGVQERLNGPGATALQRWFGLRAGAEVALMRGEPVALQEVLDAGHAVDPAGTQAYASALTAAKPEPAGDLTAREREILTWALRGAPAREIAQALTVAERTVETHLASIYRKLGVRTRVELITKLTMKEG